jgi:hypothetical protein
MDVWILFVIHKNEKFRKDVERMVRNKIKKNQLQHWHFIDAITVRPSSPHHGHTTARPVLPVAVKLPCGRAKGSLVVERSGGDGREDRDMTWRVCFILSIPSLL